MQRVHDKYQDLLFTAPGPSAWTPGRHLSPGAAAPPPQRPPARRGVRLPRHAAAHRRRRPPCRDQSGLVSSGDGEHRQYETIRRLAAQLQRPGRKLRSLEGRRSGSLEDVEKERDDHDETHKEKEDEKRRRYARRRETRTQEGKGRGTKRQICIRPAGRGPARMEELCGVTTAPKTKKNEAQTRDDKRRANVLRGTRPTLVSELVD